MPAHRRDFLRSSLAASTLVSLGAATVPTFMARSARAAGATASKANDRALVVVQLIGGNDGLNTVVPFGHDGYARGRRALRLNAGQVHKLTQGDRPAPGDGGDGEARRGRPGLGRAGGRLPEPGPLPLPLDGDLGVGPASNRGRPRPAGSAGRSTRRRPGRARTSRRCTWATGPCRWRCDRSGRRSPRSTAWRRYRLQLGGSASDRRAGRDALDAMARLERAGDDPLARLPQAQHPDGLRVEHAARSR